MFYRRKRGKNKGLQHHKKLELNPEIAKARETLPDVEKVKTFLRPAWKRWAENIGANLLSAIIGGVFTMYLWPQPVQAPVPTPPGYGNTICFPDGSARETIPASMTVTVPATRAKAKVPCRLGREEHASR